MKSKSERHLYEIFLTAKAVSEASWQQLFQALADLSHLGDTWQIFTIEKNSKLHFYLDTSLQLPASLNNIADFLFQSPENHPEPPTTSHLRLSPNTNLANLIELRNYFEIKKQTHFLCLAVTFHKLLFGRYSAQTFATITKSRKKFTYRLIAVAPAHLLAIDFESNRHLLCKSAPKYLDAQKALPHLKDAKNSAFLSVETFPYQTKRTYFNQKNLDFAKHSLVLGASGSGKSKFLSLFIENLATDPELQQQYKVVVIDPHAALENDIGAYARTIDFLDEADSIQLFDNSQHGPVVATELMLDLFKNLMADNFNSKLARVLRHSISILLSIGEFNFHSLHELLLNLEYRNQVLQRRSELPTSSLEFFLTEYNEIKTRSYTEAISPIIGFIDEVEMIPVLGKPINAPSLKTTISEHFLTLFSLDRTKLGDRVTTTISGIIMQQLLTMAQNHSFDQHIIFIIDEVAVVENPILGRFLAEARKFNLSLILAGQYFGGISPALRTAIFANTTNYYIFRVAKDDAASLVQSFDFKIPLDDTPERKIKTLTDLQNRECVARVSCGDQLLPAVKCQTLDFVPKPRVKKSFSTVLAKNIKEITAKIIEFTTETAKKFQNFLESGRHNPHRIQSDNYENHITIDPAKIKLGVKNER